MGKSDEVTLFCIERLFGFSLKEISYKNSGHSPIPANKKKKWDKISKLDSCQMRSLKYAVVCMHMEPLSVSAKGVQ